MMQLRHDQRILDTVDDRPMGAAALLDMIDAARPEWHSRAACRGQQDVMFPGAGRSYLAAQRLCLSCPVAAECREAGRNEHDGVWGGVIKDRGPAGRKHVSMVTQNTILEWFKANPGWHTMVDIRAGCAHLGRHERTVQNAVRILTDDGLIDVRRGGQRHLSPPTYALREDA